MNRLSALQTVERCIRRWKDRNIFTAFNTWKRESDSQNKVLAIMKRVIAKFRHNHLSRAVATWKLNTVSSSYFPFRLPLSSLIFTIFMNVIIILLFSLIGSNTEKRKCISGKLLLTQSAQCLRKWCFNSTSKAFHHWKFLAFSERSCQVLKLNQICQGVMLLIKCQKKNSLRKVYLFWN